MIVIVGDADPFEVWKDDLFMGHYHTLNDAKDVVDWLGGNGEYVIIKERFE